MNETYKYNKASIIATAKIAGQKQLIKAAVTVIIVIIVTLLFNSLLPDKSLNFGLASGMGLATFILIVIFGEQIVNILWCFLLYAIVVALRAALATSSAGGAIFSLILVIPVILVWVLLLRNIFTLRINAVSSFYNLIYKVPKTTVSRVTIKEDEISFDDDSFLYRDILEVRMTKPYYLSFSSSFFKRGLESRNQVIRIYRRFDGNRYYQYFLGFKEPSEMDFKQYQNICWRLQEAVKENKRSCRFF